MFCLMAVHNKFTGDGRLPEVSVWDQSRLQRREGLCCGLGRMQSQFPSGKNHYLDWTEEKCPKHEQRNSIVLLASSLTGGFSKVLSNCPPCPPSSATQVLKTFLNLNSAIKMLFCQCCMSLWIKQNNRCPLCQQEWTVQKLGKWFILWFSPHAHRRSTSLKKNIYS